MKIEVEGVMFDDFEIHHGDEAYTQVCSHCSTRFIEGAAKLSECAGEPICGVEGCDNIAEYYLDFTDYIHFID